MRIFGNPIKSEAGLQVDEAGVSFELRKFFKLGLSRWLTWVKLCRQLGF